MFIWVMVLEAVKSSVKVQVLVRVFLLYHNMRKTSYGETEQLCWLTSSYDKPLLPSQDPVLRTSSIPSHLPKVLHPNVTMEIMV
jgi:hypothetical protein